METALERLRTWYDANKATWDARRAAVRAARRAVQGAKLGAVLSDVRRLCRRAGQLRA